MIAYRYDSNGLYIGTIPCQLDPRATKEKGEDVYLLPANSTTIEPPKAKEGYNIVWNGKAWEYMEIPKPPTPPEPTPEELIEQKIAELDAQYQAQKDLLIAEYTDALIHGDSDAQELVQTEMTNLDTWYDEEYNKIVGDEEQ